MKVRSFISVGENIHCTRIFKVDGLFCKPDADGQYQIAYKTSDGKAYMPVPTYFTQGADWQAGKVKHCAVAIWLGMNGSPEEQAMGKAYLQNLAERQEAAGATYLDINVDEYSTDVEERIALMRWVVQIAQESTRIPMSIDSSNLNILEAGLAACDPSRGRPMVNSVSLERTQAIDVAKQANAVVIASAAGAEGLPNEMEARMHNLESMHGRLLAAGFSEGVIHFDPLVFPISTDGENGIRFLDTVKALRGRFGKSVHVVAGLSNISFGMPNRKLINQVFAWMCCDAGGDGGIVDPLQINIPILNELDPNSEPFKLAHALLTGEDEYGMEYIGAAREGRLA